MTNILMAIFHEHKARTGHDVFRVGRQISLRVNCDVCMYLDAERREIEETIRGEENRLIAENQS